MRRIVIYGVALLLLVVAAVVVLSSGKKKGAVAVVGTKVFLVAEQPLQAGKFIQPRSIAWREADAGQLKARNIGAEQLVPRSQEVLNMLGGVVPRNDVKTGFFITEAELLKPSDPDFLPTVLSDGMRAVSIAVNDVTGGAGLFRPGNLVDVILTVAGDKRKKRVDALSKTLLQGVRILAVNRDVGHAYKDEARKEDSRKRQNTVTLEVDPKAAEVLALAGTLGELSLSLCSTGSVDGGLQNSGVTKSIDIVTLQRATESGGKEVHAIFGSASKTVITD